MVQLRELYNSSACFPTVSLSKNILSKIAQVR